MENALFSLHIQQQPWSRRPAAIKQHIQSFKHHCKSFSGRHYLLGDRKIRRILLREFGHDLLNAYDSIRPHAYKADIARYALLYRYGGVYADLSMVFVNDVPALAKGEMGVLSQGIVKANISNGFIAARPRAPVLKVALDLIIKRVEQRFYGVSPVSITGPRLLADALGEVSRADYSLYKMYALTPELQRNNMAVVDSEGAIICLRNKTSVGGLGELGLQSSDYREMWLRRDVYNQ
jgi:mannosyltransferase OCH1-like enzyme